MKKDELEELQRISEDLLNSDTDRLRKDLDIMYKEIVLEKETPVLSESVFVEYFLPYFRNINKEENKESVLLNKWLEIAGGPYQEVTVINNAGEKLYNVPAIYNNKTVDNDILKNSDVSFNAMGSIYNKKQERLPTEAENFINQQMSSVPQFVHNAEHNSVDQERWISIFKRYENKKSLDPTRVEEDNVPISVKEDLGLIYDDDIDED